MSSGGGFALSDFGNPVKAHKVDGQLASAPAVSIDKAEHVIPDGFILCARPKADQALLFRYCPAKDPRLLNFPVGQESIKLLIERRQIREA